MPTRRDSPSHTETIYLRTEARWSGRGWELMGAHVSQPSMAIVSSPTEHTLRATGETDSMTTDSRTLEGVRPCEGVERPFPMSQPHHA